jgi:hypothetical protein
VDPNLPPSANPYEAPRSPSGVTPPRGAGDTNLTVAEWLLAILCSGIGCIMGIIWMIQGKPKGGKMLGISLLFAVLWNIVRYALVAMQQQ